jgi:4-aminobutyrate aminotransferase-like enzyme
VRGEGLYIGVEIVADGAAVPAPEAARRIINALRERKVLIGAAGKFGNVLKIRPPLCFSVADADQLIAALTDVLDGALGSGSAHAAGRPG